VNAPAAFLAPRPDSAGQSADRTVRLDPLRAPIHVVELELTAPPTVRPAGRDTADWSKVRGSVLALVRLHGHPIGFVTAEVAEPGDLLGTLVEAARATLADALERHKSHDATPGRLPGRPLSRNPAGFPPQCVRRRLGVLAHAPTISVVVATRERPELLARCLESVTRLPYPRLEVIVVDNDPVTDRAERLVRDRFGDAVTYVREPRRGLAAAHNRGLAVAGGQIIAFTDDDVIVDRDWPAAIAEGFAAYENVGCVTGLIVPAELETPAQVMLEAHGGFAKGFTQRFYHRAEQPDGDPLFPFTAGRFGSGANMAFSAPMLRELGGFDPATGVGSLARGGDDLLAFFRTITAGYGLVYQPSSIVWHHHRRTAEALEGQAYGYGVGLGAYLAAAIAHEPRMLPALLRRMPRGIAYALRQSRSASQDKGTDKGTDTATWPRRLSAMQRRGLIYGPFAYIRSRWLGRQAGSIR
jgi:O-antigen biosynthesis protein